MEHFERTVSSELLHKGRVVSVYRDKAELENGAIVNREVVRHSGGVAVLAIHEDNVLFVRQFRYPFAENLYELPAGKLEQGEDPAACGLRELKEETGYRAGKISPLGVIYPSPGYIDERLHIFLASELTYEGQNLDENEFLTNIKIPYEKAIAMCLSGELKDAKTVTGLLLYHAGKR
jgi:ADP-ribose pyrophosphatase